MYRSLRKLKWFGRLAISLILFAVCISYLGLSRGETALASGNPSVQGHVFLQYGYFDGSTLNGVVFTDNLSGSGTTDKTIVSYRINGGSWHANLASKVGPVANNQTAWKYELALDGISALSPLSPIKVEFEAFYDVGTASYVDNNNGSYYAVGNDAAQLPSWKLIRSFVQLEYAEYYYNRFPATGNGFGASVVTANIGSQQNVQIIYTTDNWVTQKAVAPNGGPYVLKYSGNSVNQWTIGFNEYANQIQFKVVYTTVINFFGNPITLTYTDDNLGKYYTITVT